MKILVIAAAAFSLFSHVTTAFHLKLFEKADLRGREIHFEPPTPVQKKNLYICGPIIYTGGKYVKGKFVADKPKAIQINSLIFRTAFSSQDGCCVWMHTKDRCTSADAKLIKCGKQFDILNKQWPKNIKSVQMVCGPRPKTPKPPMKKPVMLPVPDSFHSVDHCDHKTKCRLPWAPQNWGDSCEELCQKRYKLKANYETKEGCGTGQKRCCCLPGDVVAELNRISRTRRPKPIPPNI
jgi:hypothetical protein